MTAINSLFGKMQPFVTHENVVFMFDPKVYQPVDAGCTPTAAEIVDGGLSSSGVPDGGTVTATYRIDDGPPLTVTGTLYAVNGLDKTDLIQDFLLQEIMDSRWLHDYGDPDFRGGDGSDDGGEPATLHLLLTPGADYDAVQILFGGPVDIHSCGYQQVEMQE